MESLATGVGSVSSIGPSHSGFLSASSTGGGVSAAGSAALRDRLERQARHRLEMLDADNQHDDPHADLGSAARKNIFDDDDGSHCFLHLLNSTCSIDLSIIMQYCICMSSTVCCTRKCHFDFQYYAYLHNIIMFNLCSEKAQTIESC